ncbi:hypothetical protein ACZ90_22515 [Streptomyces albus subsp. albus]|nr:hypothetical protein ACZ90_22515 [Streptomyces albus subsp. albus]
MSGTYLHSSPQPRSVACIGAGPAGLLAATEIKRARPEWRVVVHERQPKDVTYGYGVVFSDIAVRTIDYMAPSLGSLLASQVTWEDVEVRVRGQRYRIPGHGYVAVSRHRLLAELAAQAIAAGVELRYETPVHLDALRERFDLVVAADGAHSRTRQELAGELGARVGQGRSRYAWLGTTAAFDAMTFIFEETEQGVAVAHGYPHGDGVSTFVVEVPQPTADEPETGGPAAADVAAGQREADLAYWSEVFASHLGGHRLQARDLRWARFPTVRLDRCVHGNVVVIGDAAHTLHYSVGSGTRMALEDGFSLARALVRNGDQAEALAEYERRRLPSAEQLQTAGERSMRWFERAPAWLDQPAARFSLHLLGRTALPDLSRVRAEAPGLVDDAARALVREAAAAPATGGAFALPMDIGGVRLPGRLVADRTAGQHTGTEQAGPYTGLPYGLVLHPAGEPADGSGPDGAVPGTVLHAGELTGGATGAAELTVVDAGPCPADPAVAAREAQALADRLRRVSALADAPLAIRSEVPHVVGRSAHPPAAALLARLRVLRRAGLCALADLAAPRDRAATVDDLLAALEEAGVVRGTLTVPTMLSGFAARPEQVEFHLLAGRIDLWCVPAHT